MTSLRYFDASACFTDSNTCPKGRIAAEPKRGWRVSFAVESAAGKPCSELFLGFMASCLNMSCRAGAQPPLESLKSLLRGQVYRPFKQLNAKDAETAENRFQLRVLRTLRVEGLFQRLNSEQCEAAPR